MKLVSSLPLLSLLILPLLTGCATGPAEVRFTAAQTGKSVFEAFPGAYITSNRDGEYDVVLVNDTLRSASSEKASKKPLQPISQPPIQQAIHIHLFWRPVEGAMMKESSITNAIIHWYVFGGEGSRSTDMVHYQGAAFVRINPGSKTASVQIGDGQIAAREVRGDIVDPVGPSRISGSLVAVRNDARVRKLLAGFQSRLDNTAPQWHEAQTDTTSIFDK
jgi:hypothetical protein